MRLALPLMLLASALPGCSCSSQTGADMPTPVTLVFTNTSAVPVFVDATDSTFGLVITQESSPVTGPAYLESLPGRCACSGCDVVCTSAGCPGQACNPPGPANPLVELVPPGAAVQRVWPGIYFQDSHESCGSSLGTQACLQQTNDFPDDSFTARVCYALSVNGGLGADAGVPFPGALPSGDLLCVTGDFQPQQGTVQLAPSAPPSCDGPDAGACPSGQLCFSGQCTESCPGNDFPSYGGTYLVNVSTPTGPFFLQQSSVASTVSSGSGTLSSFSFSGGSTTLSLTSDAGFNGTVRFFVPVLAAGCCLEAFHPGETLGVTVTERPPASGNLGVVIRDASGALIQAADMAINGPALGALDTAPFTITPSTTPLGCSQATVGCKALYAGTTVTTAEGVSSLLAPGQLLDATTSGANFVALNVTNTSYLVTSTSPSACSAFTPLSPYVLVNSRP
jgi:hypothetical protein